MKKETGLAEAQYDGRQFAHNVLSELGLTPGDVEEFLMKDLYQNGDQIALVQGVGEKAAELGKEHTEILNEGHGLDHAAEQAALDQQHFEQQQEQQERWQQQQDDNKKFFEEKEALQERLDEEQRLQEEAAANRPAEDQMNMSIAAMPFAFAGGLLMLDAGAQITQVCGEMMSFNQGLGNPALVTSNNNGAMLACARSAMEISSPTRDSLVTGPGQTQSFVPGQTPEPGTQPGVNQPGQNMQNMPGINGPSLANGPTMSA